MESSVAYRVTKIRSVAYVDDTLLDVEAIKKYTEKEDKGAESDKYA